VLGVPNPPTDGSSVPGPPASRAVTLEARGVSAGYDQLVVEDVSLRLPPGAVTAVCGPNGSGKSTLLRVLAQLHPRAAGSVLLDGQEVARQAPRQRARDLSFLPQTPLVPTGVTVREVVEQGRFPHRRLLGGPRADDRAAVAWALHATRLDELADRDVGHVSGGERQRAWIAMALAQQSRVLLLDEPTTFLDIRYQMEVLDLLRRLADDHGITVVAVLHDLNQAAAFADHVVLMRHGRVVAAGTPAEVVTAAHIETVFGVQVGLVDDPATGRPTCLLRRPAGTPATAGTPAA
jgi:ABC-type cobalamin/Fe3+-siderophores transport system ATPase subunit